MHSTSKLKIVAAVLLVLLVSVAGAFFFVEGGESSAVVRVACVGDSITEWTGYPEDLQMLLGGGYQVEKFGVGGATILLNTDRPFLDQPKFSAAASFRPSVVVILLGTNDARTNIYQSSQNLEKDFKTLILAIEGFATKPKIFVALPSPIFSNALSLSGDNLTQGVLPRIRSVATELNLNVIDVYSALADHPEYFPDGVHPNSTGARVIANKVFEAIKS